MKRLLAIIMSLLALQCYAQDIEVTGFRQLETDLTANTAGSIVLDQNGEKCALIKVSTSKTDFKFDAGMLGVVKTVSKEGEIWVYVPEGVKRLTISHTGMETLRDHDLGLSVKKACTYLLTLKTSKDVVLQTVKFRISPANASVMLESADSDSDFERTMVSLSNGTSTMQIPVGNYRYTAMLSGYNIESGTFELTSSGPKNVLVEMVSKSGQSAPAVTPQQSQAVTTVITRQELPSQAPSFAPVENETITVNGVSFKMIGVRGGTFKTGSDDGDFVREVTLSSYHIGETEVTQQLWEAVMGRNPSSFHKNSRNPVEQVTWNDCQSFISRLNSLTGRKFRLPTQAEWEFAARGGNKSNGYAYSGSDTAKEVACFGKMRGGPEPVKSMSPNELGIYDMSGNVWEWCNDRYGDYPSTSVEESRASDRVYCGGGWDSSPSGCSVSYCYWDAPTIWHNNLGLRLAF